MRRRKHVLLIIESSTSYGRDLLRGIAQYVRERNEWWVDIENRGFFDPLPTSVKGWHGDGIISRVPTRQTLQLLRRLGCPVIDLLAPGTYRNTKVLIDETQIARLALDHFRDCRLRQFGYYSFGNCEWAFHRGNVFVDHLKKAGVSCYVCPQAPSATPSVDPFWKPEYEQTVNDWLRELPRPIGVLTANDTHANRLASACRKLDIGVPEEIAILGINNDQLLCRTLTPTLSSIDLGAERIGYESARQLDCMMTGKPLPKKAVLFSPFGIVVRQSTDMFAVDDEEVVAALRFIREHATSGIGVHDILETLNLSSRTLERGFKKHVGRTPKQEIARIRMNHAVELLRQSKFSHEAIAKLSGYGSLRYFLDIFRAEHGETPTQFRKREAAGFFLADYDANQ